MANCKSDGWQLFVATANYFVQHRYGPYGGKTFPALCMYVLYECLFNDNAEGEWYRAIDNASFIISPLCIRELSLQTYVSSNFTIT